MDRIEIGYLWVLSLLGALFIGHTIGLMQGEAEARKAHGYRFENARQAFYDQ